MSSKYAFSQYRAWALKISWSATVSPFSASSVSLSSLPPNAKSASIGESIATASALCFAVIKPNVTLCWLRPASFSAVAGTALSRASRAASISSLSATVFSVSSVPSAAALMLATPASEHIPSRIEATSPALAATALMVATDADISSNWRFLSAAAFFSSSCISLSRDGASAGSSLAASVAIFLSSFAPFAAIEASNAASTAV
mmetsp:Transcript_41681/g.97550  ORF Transcript_41681/g.97550 Transcript_41681/m.97550 type:complete len:203 (-) Transcript_41681:709-1317(-)